MENKIGYVEVNVENPFKPDFAISQIKYETSVFPGGEVHVRLKSTELPKIVWIGISVRSGNDIMLLLLMTDALRRAGVKSVNLYMPYVPYARQDRVCNYGEALSIKVFGDLINAQNYDNVIVVDPHSDVTGALLNNLYIENNYSLVMSSLNYLNRELDLDKLTIVGPDAGAAKKCHNLVSHIMKQNSLFGVSMKNVQYAQAEKHRDLKTTEIIETKVNDDVSGRDCVIVDDICDGGRTFTELAKVLKEKGANKIFLIVTHGIFSKGLKPFDGIIDYVISSNSIPLELSPFSRDELTTTNIKQIPLYLSILNE